jgi:hypothetical protein
MSPGKAPNPAEKVARLNVGVVGGQVPLEMLASELESHLAHLNNELVELINRWGLPWDQHCTPHPQAPSTHSPACCETLTSIPVARFTARGRRCRPGTALRVGWTARLMPPLLRAEQHCAECCPGRTRLL